MRFLLLTWCLLQSSGSFICQTEQLEPLLKALETPIAQDCDAKRGRMSIERACAEIPACRVKYQDIAREMPNCDYIIDANGKNLGRRLKSEIQACSLGIRFSVQVLLIPLALVMLMLLEL